MQGSNSSGVHQGQASFRQIRNQVRIERFHNVGHQCQQARLHVVAASASIVRKVISFTERDLVYLLHWIYVSVVQDFARKMAWLGLSSEFGRTNSFYLCEKKKNVMSNPDHVSTRLAD